MFSYDFDFSGNNTGKEVIFEAEKIDLLILRHDNYNPYDDSAPSLCCSRCHSFVFYDADLMDPLMSSFCCRNCDLADIKESELNSLTEKDISSRFFVSVPRESELAHVLEQVSEAGLAYTRCRPMNDEEEISYYFKVLQAYRSKFK